MLRLGQSLKTTERRSANPQRMDEIVFCHRVRLLLQAAVSRPVTMWLQSKKAIHLTSILCLCGASAGVLGSLNALCKLKVQGTSPSLEL